MRLYNTPHVPEPPREWGIAPAKPGKSAMSLFESYEKTALRQFFLRIPSLKRRVNEIDDILADFHGNANVLFEMLERDYGEPVVPGKPLTKPKPRVDSYADELNPTNKLLKEKGGVNRIKEKRSSRSIFDKLTDVKQYTGSHAHRFDKKTGIGRGIEGRDRLHVGTGNAGYYGSGDVFSGNTNDFKKRTMSAGDSGLIDAQHFLTRQF